jgi:protein tyrosine phosphatase type 4A
LVAIALIEHGLSWQQAVEEIRKRRNGAINAHQLQHLKYFKPKGGCNMM